MDFDLTIEQRRLRDKCRELAADFATRSGAHDRDASHPVENYERLRNEGFLALTVGKEWGGLGASFLDHTIAYESWARAARRQRSRSTCTHPWSCRYYRAPKCRSRPSG